MWLGGGGGGGHGPVHVCRQAELWVLCAPFTSNLSSSMGVGTLHRSHKL